MIVYLRGTHLCLTCRRITALPMESPQPNRSRLRPRHLRVLLQLNLRSRKHLVNPNISPPHDLFPTRCLQAPYKEVVRPLEGFTSASTASVASGSNNCSNTEGPVPTLSLAAQLSNRALNTRPAVVTTRKKARKCGQEDCRGRKEVKLCMNPCRDCGRVNSGRNPSKPSYKCDKAWD